ncbi:MAG TPA: Rrf2 family transcriptional regulator, partial [Acidimicrobiales bacterium]|nr:Rrf2 family transcriptional regulator [Acidimicrobiales bacterium]
EITLLEVVLAVEGDRRAFRCTEIRRCGPAAVPEATYPKPCGIAAAMHRAEDAWRASLAEVTVADMVGEALRNAHPEALERGATWIQTIVTKRGSA